MEVEMRGWMREYTAVHVFMNENVNESAETIMPQVVEPHKTRVHLCYTIALLLQARNKSGTIN